MFDWFEKNEDRATVLFFALAVAGVWWLSTKKG